MFWLILKITILLSLALLLDCLLHRRSVLAVAAIWNATLLAILILPAAALLLPAWDVPLLPPGAGASVWSDSASAMEESPIRFQEEALATSPMPEAPSVARSLKQAHETHNAPDFSLLASYALLGAFVLGVCTMLARLAAGWFGGSALCRSARHVEDAGWLDRFDYWREHMGLVTRTSDLRWYRRPPVRLLQSDRVPIPAALGVWRRAVVIPASFENANRDTIDAILAHELAHAARGDYEWLLIQRIVEATWWFHPLVWAARRRMAFIRESACDQYAAGAMGDGSVYASILLELAASAQSQRGLKLALPFLRGGNLADRIAAIQRSRRKDRWLLPAAARCWLGAAAVISSLFLASVTLGRVKADEPKPVPPNQTAAPEAATPPQTVAAPTEQSHPITVEGRALDPDGNPIKGAEIFLVATSPNKTLGQTATDEEGRYAFRSVPLTVSGGPQKDSFRQGYFQVFGKAEGRAFTWRGKRGLYVKPFAGLLDEDGNLHAKNREDSYLAGDEIKLDLTFARAWPVRGRFLDERGDPIAGVKVQLTNCDYLDIRGRESHPNSREFWALSQAAKLMPEQVLATSDTEGRFEFRSIPPEMVCWLIITHPNHARLALYTATTDAPPVEHDGHPVYALPLEIKLSAVRTIPVTVRHPETGAPVTGARVSASQSRASGSGASATSDQEGKLSLRVPPGHYRLLADPPSETELVRTVRDLVVAEGPAEQPMTLDMQLGCTLIFKAVDADTGAPVVGANYWMTDERRGRAVTTPAYSDSGKVNYPKPNEQGETKLLADPTQRRGYGIWPPKGYRTVDGDNALLGRQLDMVAGKTLTVEFRLRKTAD